MALRGERGFGNLAKHILSRASNVAHATRCCGKHFEFIVAPKRVKGIWENAAKIKAGHNANKISLAGEPAEISNAY